MSNYVTVVPAYGRDYKSKKAVLEDYRASKDFRINDMFNPYDGKYINKEDADNAGLTMNVRYSQRTKVCVIPPNS